VKFYFLAYSWVGDHYQYLAMPAALALIVSAATWVGAAMSKGLGSMGQQALSALAGAVVVLLMMLSQQQTMLYRDVERLWLDTLAKSPGAWMARHNLALHYSSLGRHADALDQFELLLARPEYPRYWPEEDSKILTNYANALTSSGRETDAEKAFRKAIDLDPVYPKPRNNLATMLANTGRFDAAIREYEALLELPLKPGERARYLLNLGTTHADRQDWPQAEAVFRAALAVDGTNAAGYEWLGIVAARQDRHEDAKRWLERAIDLETNPAARARILMNLASIHESEGDLPAAAKRASEASRLEPANTRFAATAATLARRLREEPSKPQRSITPEAQPR
jgi:tetratricopeptide (TPR) repeat protein